MYNEEIKKIYIEEINSKIKLPKRCYEMLFAKTEEFEINHNKDCCNWTTKEIIEFYKFISSRSLSYLVVVNSRLTQYTQWCLDRVMVNDFQNHYREINIKILGTCVNSNVIDKEIIDYDSLQEYLSLLENPCDKFILLGLFEGLYGKNFSDLYITTDNILKDDNGYKIVLEDKTIPISDQLANIAFESAEEYIYYPFNSTREIALKGREKDILKSKVPTDESFRSVSEINKGRRIYGQLKRMIEYLDLSKRITAKAIYYSGMIHYLNECAKTHHVTGEYVVLNEDLRSQVILKYKPIRNARNFCIQYDRFLIK